MIEMLANLNSFVSDSKLLPNLTPSSASRSVLMFLYAVSWVEYNLLTQKKAFGTFLIRPLQKERKKEREKEKKRGVTS